MLKLLKSRVFSCLGDARIVRAHLSSRVPGLGHEIIIIGNLFSFCFHTVLICLVHDIVISFSPGHPPLSNLCNRSINSLRSFPITIFPAAMFGVNVSEGTGFLSTPWNAKVTASRKAQKPLSQPHSQHFLLIRLWIQELRYRIADVYISGFVSASSKIYVQYICQIKSRTMYLNSICRVSV